MFGFSHRVVAGCVDDLNLFKVSVQKLAPDSKDVTAAAVILFYCYRLRETRPGAGRTANEREREREINLEKIKKGTNKIPLVTAVLVSMPQLNQLTSRVIEYSNIFVFTALLFKQVYC